MRSPGVDPVEGEPCLAWDVEPGDGQGIHFALALSLGRALLKLLQAILKKGRNQIFFSTTLTEQIST